MPMSERLKNAISFLNGFRKLTIIAVLILVGVIFRVTGHLTGMEMVELLRYTVVAFMAGNTVEHIGKAVQEWVKGNGKNVVDRAKND